VNVDELERRFIRAAQHELAPSAADRERNQAALLDRLAAEPWSGGSGAVTHRTALDAPSHFARSAASGALAGVVGAMRGSRLGMLGVGLVVGAMVGGWFGFGLGRSGWSPSAWNTPPARVSDAVAAPHAAPLGGAGQQPSAPPEASPVAVEEAPAAAPDALELEAPAPGAASDDAASGDAARNRAPAVNRARAVRRAAAAPAQPESSLAVELAMLQRARRALNAENGRLALGIVEELDERFPKGVLVEERSATRILSLCQLERAAEAKQAARDFLERYPSSVYAERVRQSCAASPP
jgi:hypothetical protein